MGQRLDLLRALTVWHLSIKRRFNFSPNPTAKPTAIIQYVNPLMDADLVTTKELEVIHSVRLCMGLVVLQEKNEGTEGI